MVALDIDHFKRVNDEHGHDVGDEVLRFLAEIMTERSRPTDVLCRMGGEEFLMLLPETDATGASVAAERLMTRLRQTASPTGSPVTVSIGIACSDSHASHEASFKAADEALYQAKKAAATAWFSPCHRTAAIGVMRVTWRLNRGWLRSSGGSDMRNYIHAVAGGTEPTCLGESASRPANQLF